MFIKTESWLKKTDDCDGDEMFKISITVDYTTSMFCDPLESKGMYVEVLQDELHEAVEYAQPSNWPRKLQEIWHKLHTCPTSNKWNNVLLPCELIFNLLLSTSHVEQMFSLLKATKAQLWGRPADLHTR